MACKVNASHEKKACVDVNRLPQVFFRRTHLKLADIKARLLERHFGDVTDGLALDLLAEAYAKLGAGSLLVESEPARLADLSKAFRRFADGRAATLAIVESDIVLLTAYRAGRTISFTNHTTAAAAPKQTDLTTIKDAMKQAQAVCEDVLFHIQVQQ